MTEPTFARDAATATCHERRARERDDRYAATGASRRGRPGWDAAVATLPEPVAVAPAR